MQAIMVVRADIQEGGIKRTVHGYREVEEGSRSCISMLYKAVSRIIIGFDIFV
jgi:hypothetical protein